MNNDIYNKRVLIFIVTYNAEKTIRDVLRRIPAAVFNYQTEILIIDDSSQDHTFDKALDYLRDTPVKINVLFNPENQGYGGNQKLGYLYAVKHGFDMVALLHGDGQYAPEELPNLLLPVAEETADMVIGSRMLHKGAARKGGMPLYKRMGNRILTALQNYVLGVNLSEFHSGYRVYAVNALAQIPFHKNTNDFHFDTEIIIQFIQKKLRIIELPIPTFYGDEICYVNGIKYAYNVIKSTLLLRCFHMGIYYRSNYDVNYREPDNELKLGYTSSHTLALSRVKDSSKVLEIGYGKGHLGKELKKKSCYVETIDKYPLEQSYRENVDQFTLLDMDDIDKVSHTIKPDRFDYILVLDILEHMQYPDLFLEKLRERSVLKQPTILITTPNIAFFIIRFQLLLGNFNYHKRGILDLQHTRLFTFKSLEYLLIQTGFKIREVRGIPAPFPKALGDNLLSRSMLFVNTVLIAIWKKLFSYQILVVCEPLPPLDALMEATYRKSKKLKQQYQRAHKQI
jgi:glycosyltransferase involved in cell wall biosynthesis